jgi:uncharacterized protein YdeI (YjbR/CyaY-like superfamily)
MSTIERKLTQSAMSDIPIQFENSLALRQWFAKNALFETALVVDFYKTSTGLASVNWPEAVDEALCVGWIDGPRQSVSDKKYTVRFTRRKPSSEWTAIHVKRAAVLFAQGRMLPAGLAVFKARKPSR